MEKRRCKRIGANPEGESGPGGPPSDHRERFREAN